MGCGASKEGGGGDKYELEMIGSHPQNVLPAFCAANAHLRKVNVSSCELRVLPAAINFLVALEELDCSQNKLEALPNEIGDCVNLKTLDCNDNQLATLPDTLGKCKNLAQLIAYKNALGALPAALGELKELNELNCFNNKLLKLPPTLGGMAGLEEVNLAANKVMQLPKESVAEWTGVKVFNVYDCRLVRLAPLAHMVQLTELRLFGNNLEDMPDCGGGLPALRLLELHRNRIASIPAGFFSKMTSLRRLTISSNKLAAVPADIGACPLESLLLDGNELTSIPSEVATIPTLTVLFVQENQITALPDSFLQNSSLKRVNLAKNPITGCESHIKHLKATCTDAFWEP